MSCPSSLFFPLRLSCIFSFVGFFCIRFCSPIGLGWLALSFFIGPASFETCCSAWCASWPPRVLTPLLHQYIQGWHGWPVISSVVVFCFLSSCEHAYACRHFCCDWSHELRRVCVLLPPLLSLLIPVQSNL